MESSCLHKEKFYLVNSEFVSATDALDQRQ